MDLKRGRRSGSVHIGLNVTSQLSGLRHGRELRVLEFTNASPVYCRVLDGRFFRQYSDTRDSAHFKILWM